MAAGLLGNPARPQRLFESALHHGLMKVVPAPLTARAILVHPPRWKHPLPTPLSARIRVFGTERTGERNPACPLLEVALVLRAHLGQMLQ